MPCCHPVVIEILLLLSAVKFALVAMFYMHLKQDSKIFSGLFVFPILIAAFVIIALLTLFSYLYLLHPRPTSLSPARRQTAPRNWSGGPFRVCLVRFVYQVSPPAGGGQAPNARRSRATWPTW